MALLNGYSPSRLLNRFSALGPYICQSKCNENYFFFDCLAICVDAKSAPEKREFWGWWMELKKYDNQLIYTCHLGLSDYKYHWEADTISDPEIRNCLQERLMQFCDKLKPVLAEMQLELIPSDDSPEKPVTFA